MDQSALISQITIRIADQKLVQALFLGGSYGRGTADAYSDVDLIALVDSNEHAEVATRWRSLLESITPIVFWNQSGQSRVLLNAVTVDWLRCDVIIMPPTGLSGRARDTIKPLIDPQGFYDALPETLPARKPDPERVQFLISEFIRVLGLLRVVTGRGEYLTAVVGAGMLRDHLTSLMLEEVSLPDRGGALHLSKVLPAEDMKLLLSLPFPRPESGEVIEANFQIARCFFPRARALAEKLNIPWPNSFEAATRQMLTAEFGTEYPIDWQ